MEPVGTWVVVAQQGRLVLQLAPKCSIFHGSAESSATDAWTRRESTSLPVLYSLLMATHIIVIVAGEARQQREVTFTLVDSLNWQKWISAQFCSVSFITFSVILHSSNGSNWSAKFKEISVEKCFFFLSNLTGACNYSNLCICFDLAITTHTASVRKIHGQV